jgi:hypothetical protein
MPESSKHTDKDNTDKDKAGKSSARSSSQGDSPVEMTPKDVSPKDATWQDRTERNIKSENDEERTNALVDEASELSFPASDPIAVSPPTKLVKDKDGSLHPASEKPKNQS